MVAGNSFLSEHDMDLSHALEIVARTHPGLVRGHNEDALYCSARHGLAILADGMGGYKAGEVASAMATALLSAAIERALSADTLQGVARAMDAKQLLDTEVVKANRAIYEAAMNDPRYTGMGTTLVAALFHDKVVTVAHLGDSRLYRLREREFRRLTRDHSLLQEQIDMGMVAEHEAKTSLSKNLVTRALGVDPEVEPEVRDYDVLPGDVYLLCSDGLTDMMDDEEIAESLSSLSSDLALAGDRLIRRANDNGGHDNVSVILIKVMREYPPSAPASRGFWRKQSGM